MSWLSNSMVSLAAALFVLLGGGSAAIAGDGLFGTGIPSSMDQLRGRIGDGSRGIVLSPRVPESTSGLTVLTPPRMDKNGNISNGTTRSDYSRAVVAHGQLRYDAGGLAWWYSNYSDAGGRVNSPVRADSRFDRIVPPPFQIDQAGRVFLNSTYLGQAKRGREMKSGRTGWYYQIPNGWLISRYDNDQMTHAKR